MIRNEARIANFTSSKIAALNSVSKDKKGFGKPALTYIAETNMERRLGRSLNDESNARSLTWGKLLERLAFEKLPLQYTLNSTDTITHPIYDFWSGSPDGFKGEDTVVEIKAPFTLKSYCQLVEPLAIGLSGIDAMNHIRDNHSSGEDYYWQIVSNAILSGRKYGELVVFMPYLSEIPEVMEMAQNVEPELLHNHYWIAMAKDGDLPYLLDGGYYKNLNTITFEIPESDKELLTANVVNASKLLIDRA